MKVDILTLFPEFYDSFLNTSIIKRAIDNKLVKINLINIRDFSTDKHNKVDFKPYGGGAGMVLRIDFLVSALESVKKEDSIVILLDPTGKTFDSKDSIKLSKIKHLIFICGHYEGIDARIYKYVDYIYSLGNFIMTGGEVASLPIIDSIIRQIPGVISEDSLLHESFNEELLDYDNYTIPRDFRGDSVPEVLVNGDHKKIEEWRQNNRLDKTRRKNTYEGF